MINSNIEPELNSLRSKLVVEIENDTKQIEILKKRITKNEELLHAVKGSLGALNPIGKPSGYGSKSETIREAIESIQSRKFTQTEVEEAIRKLNPDMIINRNRIRAALWTLQDRKEMISVSRKGNNNQPAEYEKLDNASNGTKSIAELVGLVPARKSFTVPPRPKPVTEGA
jgi:Arc/MetJ-type ribon-helix-helix transcriptional regulator